MLPLHPKLVHLPIALAVLMPLIVLGLGLAIRKLWLPQRAWVLALALQGVLLGGGFAARWSGERDEHRVEGRVPESALKAHEGAANLFLVGAGGVLVLVAVGAVTRRPGAFLGLMGASFAGSLLVLGLGYRVGEAGGQLVYGQGGVAGPVNAQGSPAPEQAEHDEAREHEGREHP